MICLIRPPGVEWFRFTSTSIMLPLGLAYIAGALEATGRKVCVIDAAGEAPHTMTRYYKGHLVGLTLEEIVARIPADSQWVGISTIFTHEWPSVVRLVELIKEAHPHLPIVLGGEHITSLPEFSLMTSKADVLVLGEGEETVVELAKALETGRPLSQIEGIVYREQDRIVFNKRRKRNKNVDDIAWPAWEHFQVKTYREHHGHTGGMFSQGLSIPILATRGCPYQCTYCSSPNMWTTTWIPRDPAKVADEIQFYKEKYGATSFPFQDLTAIIQKEWIVAFCNELINRKLNITWQMPFGTRSEAVDAEVADLLYRSGMCSMAYAPESASEETRRLIKKKMHTEKLMASMRASKAAGLSVDLFFVIGFPHDTRQSIQNSLPTLEKLATLGVQDIGLNFYMALPGTELFHSLYDAGKICLDKKFFQQILHSNYLIPAESYSDDLTPMDLMRLKLRMYWRFYKAKRRSAEHISVGQSLWRAVKGLFDREKEREYRMESAFRNLYVITKGTLRVLFGKRWMPRKEENRMFRSWDAIYRQIREQKLSEGIATRGPADTRQLHLGNVINNLRKEHNTPRTFALPGTPMSAARVEPITKRRLALPTAEPVEAGVA